MHQHCQPLFACDSAAIKTTKNMKLNTPYCVVCTSLNTTDVPSRVIVMRDNGDATGATQCFRVVIPGGSLVKFQPYGVPSTFFHF